MTDCSFCDGKAVECIEKRDFAYKGEVINIDQHYYKCNNCGEEFTTDKLDDKTLSNLKKEYWKSHVEEGVLFDNVISDLDKQKTLAEYKYMLEHDYIYTEEQKNTIIQNFDINKFPELKELYTEWITKN
jgi:YgiT-type zinc finger domain-containing protein